MRAVHSVRGRALALSLIGSLALVGPLTGDEMPTRVLASNLIALKSTVLKETEAAASRNVVTDENLVRLRAANERQTAEYEKIVTAGDWEKFRDERLSALKKSFASSAQPLKSEPLPAGARAAPGSCEVTGTYEGDGFRILNLVIPGRPGLPITANLYTPATPSGNRPGILIVTSHHNAKTQGELLDMGETWARSGCPVIVADNIGYGERSQQCYGGHEDYRWRYYMGMQLHTVGESLMGWMVADLRRVLDVLVAQSGVDANRIIVLGSVAGGGDIAGVLAALDRRVACAVPFNYGSARASQPTPEGGTGWINFIGGGDFDAVRCLHNNGRDGFNPWVILASLAPRHLIFAKEFDWQPAGDKGYERIVRVFDLCGVRDHIETVHGFGEDSVRDRPRSPANNIVAAHRAVLYPVLARWFQMPIPEEVKAPRLSQELTCLTPAARTHWKVRPVNEVLADLAVRQVASARAALGGLPAEKRRDYLRQAWAERLGNGSAAGPATLKRSEPIDGNGFVGERLFLSAEAAIPIPALLLKPKAAGGDPAVKPPVVICVAQEGKGAFIAKRALELATLLQRGVAVCLVDVRGTGETNPDGHDRYWYSEAVDLAAREMMLGQTILGKRLGDLRGALRYLQSRPDLDGRRVAVWGDSFAPVNSRNLVDPPMKTEVSALQAEPMGATAAVLLALFEDDVRAVVARGGLTGFAALLDGPACHVVMDVIVPQVLETGDLSEAVAALAPRPVRLEALVDGRNRLAPQDRLERELSSARTAYRAHPGNLVMEPAARDDVAEWLAAALGEPP